MADDYTPVMIPTAIASQVTPVELAGIVRAHVTKKAEYARQGISYDGLTTVIAPPVVAPAYVRFKDPTTGLWLAGVSEPKIDPNMFRMDLNVKAYAPCQHRRHHRPEGCDCPKTLTGVREGPCNLATNVYAKFVQAAVMGQTTSITDTGSASRSVTNTVDGGVNQRTGHAGTGATAATVADIVLQTPTESSTSVTINAVSGAGSTGTFTITFTVTAGALRSYTEVGLAVRTTTGSWNFLLFRDTFSALSVSNGGTLATTYTVTNS
jgi:hypothetical protein